MRTVLHIFLKDVRQMRWTLALWVVLLAVQVQSALSAKQTTLSDWDMLLLLRSYGGPHFPVWTVLHWLGLVVLTFEVILADRPCGTEAFWKTRPLARWHVWAAKILFLALFAALLPAALEFLNFNLQGIPPSESARGVLLSLLGQLHILGWMAMVAALCRRRTLEVLCLAPLSVALPFICTSGWGDLTEWLAAWLRLGSPYSIWPDEFSEPSLLTGFLLGWPAIPIVLALFATGLCYQRGGRHRPLALLACAGVAVALAEPFFLLVSHAHVRQPAIASAHTNTIGNVAWLAAWGKRSHQQDLPQLTAKWNLPELPGTEASVQLHLLADGWPALLARTQSTPRWRASYGSVSPGTFRLTQPDAYEDERLTRTNGPLTRLLGTTFTVLNPREGSLREASANWIFFPAEMERWHQFALQLRLKVEANDLVAVRRVPFQSWANEQPHRNSEPADEDATAPARTVLVMTPHLMLPIWQEQSAAWFAPRKALLWHPKRRELVLPSQTTLGGHHGHHGVLALSPIFRVHWHQHRSLFPRLDKLLPGPAISEREWLAEAEVILLAFKPVATRHHIIHVPDVPLPPVPAPKL